MQLDNDVDLICRVIPVVLDTLNQQQSLFCGILTFEDIGTLPFAFRNPQSVEKVQTSPAGAPFTRNLRRMKPDFVRSQSSGFVLGRG